MPYLCVYLYLYLNPKSKVDSPPFAATVAAAPLQHYQIDLVQQPLALTCIISACFGCLGIEDFGLV